MQTLQKHLNTLLKPNLDYCDANTIWGLKDIINSIKGFTAELICTGDQEEPNSMVLKVIAPRGILSKNPKEAAKRNTTINLIALCCTLHSTYLSSGITPNLKSTCPIGEWTDQVINIYHEIPYIHYGS